MADTSRMRMVVRRANNYGEPMNDQQSPYQQQPYQQQPMPPYDAQQPPAGGEWMGITSMILGILTLGAWCIPLCGFPLSVAGLVLGIMGLKTRSRGMAIAGIVMCSIGLALSIINAIIGAYLGATGQHPLLNQQP